MEAADINLEKLCLISVLLSRSYITMKGAQLAVALNLSRKHKLSKEPCRSKGASPSQELMSLGTVFQHKSPTRPFHTCQQNQASKRTRQFKLEM